MAELVTASDCYFQSQSEGREFEPHWGSLFLFFQIILGYNRYPSRTPVVTKLASLAFIPQPHCCHDPRPSPNGPHVNVHVSPMDVTFCLLHPTITYLSLRAPDSVPRM